MYGIDITTPASGSPVDLDLLKTHLRINGDAEDDLLEEYLAAAVATFEADTRRPVLATVFRQYLTDWPAAIVLGRGGVTAVGGVYKFLANGSTSAVTGYRTDLRTPPARVIFDIAIPDLVETAGGYTVIPVGYVDFTAGWANAAAVPPTVAVALKLLAGHFYANREAFHGESLEELPLGWKSVCDRYRLGLSGDWGQ
ncbi:MAG: head-tail connector protein [Ardenticatenales bacterium]